MKKTILTIAGSALIALSTVQLAAAATEHHHGKLHHRTYSEFRDSNAYSESAYPADQAASEAYRYSAGHSDMAGH